MEHEGDGDTDCDWCAQAIPEGLIKSLEDLKMKRTSGDHPDYNIIKLSQNTGKSPGVLRRFAVP